MKPDLMPCPFCSGPALWFADYIKCGAGWVPDCPGHQVKATVENWNARGRAGEMMNPDAYAANLSAVEARSIAGVGAAGERGWYIHSTNDGVNWLAVAMIERRKPGLVFTGFPKSEDPRSERCRLTEFGKRVAEAILRDSDGSPSGARRGTRLDPRSGRQRGPEGHRPMMTARHPYRKEVRYD